MLVASARVLLEVSLILLGAHAGGITLGDLSGDGMVDFGDLWIFANQWGRSDCQKPDWCVRADLNCDGEVDVADLAELVAYWLVPRSEHVFIATWNVRGYPEKEAYRREWFSAKLIEMGPDIICIQEIGNQGDVDHFMAHEEGFTSAAFVNSSDGQDNAIISKGRIGMEDLPDPNGFQHPAQAAYLWCEGFDAVIVTVHLSYKDAATREQEKVILQGVVQNMLQKDPDVIIAGDFNVSEDNEGIQDLAESLGMEVMVPAGQDGVDTTKANRYDHFLISPDLASEEALGCEILMFPGEAILWEVSDHRPVLAAFGAREQFRDRE